MTTMFESLHQYVDSLSGKTFRKARSAIMSRNMLELDKALRKVKDINTVTDKEYNNKLLHICALNGWEDGVIKLIKEYGHKVDCWNKVRQTPLHIAAMSQHIKCIYLLCRHGASVAQKDVFGRTPLQKAMCLGNNLLAVQAILNCDSNPPYESNNDPIFDAVRSGDSEYIYALAKTKMIYIHNQDNYSKNTPLHMAVKHNNYVAVKALVNMGADLRCNKNRETPFTMACKQEPEQFSESGMEEWTDIIRFLMRSFVEVCEEDSVLIDKLRRTGLDI